MAYNLASMAKAKGIRRPSITLRPIVPTQAQASDLAAIYAPAWRVWAEAQPAIMAAYDPVPLADGLIRDTIAGAEIAIDAAANTFRNILVATITPSLRRWAVSIQRWHLDKWVSAVKAGTGIDLSTLLTATGETETVEAFVARNVALVRNVSDQAQARISDAVYRGYQQRTAARDVAKEIGEAVGMGRARATRIASDQLSKLSATLDMERQAEAGLTKYKYRHSGKRHPRQNHKARDGFVYVAKTGKSTNGGPKIPTDDRASMAPYCGCREQAYIDLLDEID